MCRKVVCFAGHRDVGLLLAQGEKMRILLEELIRKGYTVFYNGGMGAFDKDVGAILFKLKVKYSHIKIIRVETYYHHDRDISEFSAYDECFTLPLEEVHFKRKIIVKNQWIVDHSNILVCNVYKKSYSGAYRTMQYAIKKGVPVINLAQEKNFNSPCGHLKYESLEPVQTNKR